MHGLGASSHLTSELACAGLGGAEPVWTGLGGGGFVFGFEERVLAVILVIFWFFRFFLWLGFG